MQEDDLFELYLKMLVGTEAPTIYHRWSFLAILGAWLGRRYYLPFGRNRINCNMYVMLLGGAGSRKSTAIKDAVAFLRDAGYDKIAANKTSKEKFLLDLAGETEEGVETIEDPNSLAEKNIFGQASDEDAEILIAADEFNVFLGNGNLEFLALLGDLWDYNGAWKNTVKNSRSAYINNPTVSLLAGNTAQNFALAFPIEAIGQGIFSRMLFIGGSRTGKKITIPPQPNEVIKDYLLTCFRYMKDSGGGAVELSPEAYKLADKLYNQHPQMKDVRFESYHNRRLTHLLKLSMILAVSRIAVVIEERDVLKANTILTYAEHFMPSALGEFGKSANSDITNKIVTILEESAQPALTLKTIWKQVYNDLDKPDDLRNIISSLIFADRVVVVGDSFVAKSKYMRLDSFEIDLTMLTEDERKAVTI